jgi:hypothetical protein
MKKHIYLMIIFAFLSGSSLYAQVATTLLRPADGSQCQALELELAWTQMVNATNYDVQVTTTSGDYTSPIINESGISETTYDAVVNQNSSTFYWRVRTNYSGTFAWSDEFWFETRKEGTTTELPVIGDICLANPIAFQWTAITGATSYQIQISPNQSFNNPEVNNTSVNSNTFSTPLTRSYEPYYWRVRANYSSGTISCVSEWSNSASFTLAVLPPYLDFPENQTKGQDFGVGFVWTPEGGSASYTIQISESSNFASILHEQSGLTNSQYFYELDEEYNKQYYWRVKAVSSSMCESAWSEVYNFRTRLADVTLVSPEDNSTCISVENAVFEWNATDGVNSYRLQISETNNFATPVRFDIPSVASNTFSMELPNSLSEFFWRVRAEDENNIGNWSQSRKLTSSLFAPDLVLPVNDSTETFIVTSLSWDSRNSTSLFNLQVATSPNFEPSSLITNEVNLTDKNYDVTLPSYGTNYYWRVSASFTECVSSWSETRRFTSMTGTPNLISPANDATNQPLSILFDWSDVLFALNYDIEISRTNDFAVIESGRIGVDTSLILISNLQPSTTYYWRVRSNTGISKTPYSAVRRFVTGVEPAIRPRKIEPRDLSELRPTDEIFIWTTSSDASFYEFQLSLNDTFTDLVEDKKALSDTTTIVTDLENYKVYYWRVRSGNTSGVSAWTVPFRFRTIAPEITDIPVLGSPEDESTEIDHRRVNFEWFPVENTTEVKGGYHLQVARSSNFNENVDFDSRSVFDNKHSVFSLNHTTNYFWRVRGYNEAGDGPWSEPYSFTTLDFSSVVSQFINEISISPNPVNQDNLTLNFNLDKSGETTISIFNIKGNEVIKLSPKLLNQGNHNININLNNLSNGTYFLIIDNDGNRASINFNVVK